MANVESYYMNNGCFWCLIDDNNVIGTIAICKIDDAKRIVELKRMFVLPEFHFFKKRYKGSIMFW